MNLLSQRNALGVVLGASFLGSTAQAQSKVAAPKTKAGAPVKRVPKPAVEPDAIRDDLLITPLPQVPVEFEFVGTQKDLLGLVQSLARGAATKDKTAAPEVVAPVTAQPEAATPAATPPVASNVDADKDEKIKFNFSVTAEEMLQMLGDIHFLRAQSFNFIKLEHQQGQVRTRDADLKLANGSLSAESYQKLMKEPFPQHLDVQEFYGQQFRAQKGRRQLFLSGGDTDGTGRDDTTVSIWLFDAPRSWALVTQGPSRAIVVRADSFPPLEVAGRLIREALKD